MAFSLDGWIESLCPDIIVCLWEPVAGKDGEAMVEEGCYLCVLLVAS